MLLNLREAAHFIWFVRKGASIMKAPKSSDMFVDAARQAVRKAGWSPRFDLEIYGPDSPTEARQVHYGYRADNVRLVRPPDLQSQVTKASGLLGGAGLGKPEDLFQDVVASRVFLQIGSFKICPFSVYDYYEIREACADGLRSAGANEPEIINFTVPVTSFFIASVVSGVYAIEGPDPASYRRGWPLDHIVSSITSETTLQTYVALYANVQLRLWSDNEQLTDVLRTRFPYPFDALDFETDRGVSILLDTLEHSGTGQDGLAWDDEDDSVQEFIINELKYNWRSWPIKAFQWAEMIAPYIVAEQQGRQLSRQPQPNSRGRRNRPSHDARSRREMVRSTFPQGMQDLPRYDKQPHIQVPGVPFEPFAHRLTNDPWFRRRLMQIGIGCGSPPAHSMDFETLDTLYRGRVTKVEIESEVIHRKGMAFDIAYMAREELGSGFPSLDRIDWGATRIFGDGTPKLYEKKIPVTDETPAKFEMAGFPDLLFIVDSSGSMSWDPRGGTGPYDSLLRAIYSVFNFLERHNKAQYMKFGVVNFSGTTVTTPWHPFAELEEVKKSLFQHQNGGTKLDCAVVRRIVQASTDRFLCLMVTDAQISNAQEVFATIRLIADSGHGFAFVQIGQPSPLTQQLQDAAFAVHVIADHRELGGLCLDYARKTW